MAETKTEKLTTTGMHCASCAMLIEMNVGEMDGVEEVKVSLDEGTTEVTFDADAVAVGDIVAEIVKAGYGAESPE